ncbi:MAG: DUF4345 domain-containing protein [Calditrichia bacterium]
MKNSIVRSLLAVSGLIALGIGFTILFQPHALFASNGIALGDDPNLLSEVRAPGGLLIGCGIAILLSTFRYRNLHFALMLSATAYGLFGMSRLISMLLDGVPSSPLIAATVVELLIGGVCLLAIHYFNQNETISVSA